MGWVKRWVRRMLYLFNRTQEERDVDEEMRFHVQMETRDLIASGVPAAEAARRARRSFGGVERHRQAVRDVRGVSRLDDLVRDTRFALRTLARSPGFTLAVLLILALGIGATTAIFGVVRTVLLKPLPYPDADRLVRVWAAAPVRENDRVSLSVPDQRDWSRASSSLQTLALWTTRGGELVLSGEGPAEELSTAYIAGDYFGVFAVPAALGRTLTLDDEAAALHVVVLSHDYWNRRFGGDSALVGRILTLDEQSFEVVGIMPPGFAAPEPDVDAWAPLATVPQDAIPWQNRGVRFLGAVGRLAPGVGLAQAESELGTIAAGIEAANPESNEGITGAVLRPLQQSLVGDVSRALWIALGAVAFVLLIACANVANLLLARGTRRRSEVAVRMSLGAGRGQIVRQLMVECAVLGVGGGILGLVVATLSTGFFLSRGGDVVPRTAEVGLDLWVVTCAVALTLATTFIFGLLPALRAADVSLSGALREGGRGSGAGMPGVRLRRSLVGAEVALAVMLLLGATLLVKSLERMAQIDPGFEADGVATLALSLSTERYPERDRLMGFYHSLLDGIAALPDVTAVGSIRHFPPRGSGEQWEIAVPGLYEPTPDDDNRVDVLHVGGAAFAALGIPVLDGRVFDARDGAQAPPVTVVNEALVRRFFQGSPAVGRMVAFGGGQAMVIGVVGDVRHRSLVEPAVPTAYIHLDQNTRVAMSIMARTTGDPEDLLPRMRDLVNRLEANQPITGLSVGTEAIGEATARSRFFALLLGAFAGLGVLLASLGIYGVISYTVRQRVHEFGLRMALGAERRDILSIVVRQGMVPVGLGLGMGLTMAAVLGQLLRNLLYEVSPLDAASFATATATFVLVALAACVIPALSASRLTPAAVLRSE